MDTPSTSLTRKTEPLGIVLSAGGARAAYQVGVLKYIAEAFPEFNPGVFTGISAGSINAAFLSQGQPMPQATTELYALWSKLDFDQVLQTHFSSVLRLGLRWLYDLFVSKVTQRLLLKSILDASPLAHTLLLNIHFWKSIELFAKGGFWGWGLPRRTIWTGSLPRSLIPMNRSSLGQENGGTLCEPACASNT